MSSFLERIAQAAAANAPADLGAQAEPEPPRSSPRRSPPASSAIDPHAEPPAGHGRRRKRSSSSTPRPSPSPSPTPAAELEAEDDEPCPAWILRRARGEHVEGDPIDGGRKPTWPADILPLVELLESGDPLEFPASPFKLQPWVTITDGPRWLAGIRREVAAGTRSPRARMGTVQEDVRFLALRLLDREPTADELEAARRGASFG